MPFDPFDIPSVAGKDTLLSESTLRERPDPCSRVITSITGCGKSCAVWRGVESTYGFSMCRPRGDVVHVGSEMLDDSG